MTNIFNLKAVKVLAIVAFATVAMFTGFAIQKASAAYESLAACPTLKQGSSGACVMTLQTAIGASADGSFGPMTKAALMSYQSANMLTADGVAGPMTKAKIMAGTTTSTGGTYPAGCTSNSGYSTTTGQPCTGGTSFPAGCTSTVGYSPTTGMPCSGGTTPTSPSGPLSGTDGTLTSFTELSQYSSEEVGEGQEDVKVVGFELEASNDGDISIKSLKIVNTITNGSGSKDLDDYVDSMDVWMGSTKVGSADADDFNEDSSGVWSKTVTLSNSVVRADDSEKFYITVNAANSFDSGDIDSESFVVDVTAVRYVDGSGVTTTDTTTSGIGSVDVTVAFVSFSASADTELKISANDTPDSTTVAVDTSDNTDDVVMLEGELEVEGDSDVWLDELPVTLTATGDSPVATTGSVTLIIDGETYTETVTTSNASTATITFDDLDLDIEAGDTIDFKVTADINDIENTGAATTDFDEGDQLTISLTTSNRASIVAENEQGDSLTDSTEMTGSATGNVMTFRSEGVNVVMGTTTYDIVSNDSGVVTQVTYTIPVKVTSFGETLYVGQSGQFATTATASNAFAVVFENSSTPTTADVTSSGSIAISSDASIVGNGYVLNDGDSEDFTVEVTLTTPGLLGAISAGNYRVRLDDIRYFTNSGLSGDTATSADLLPTSDFRTGFKYITS